MEVIHTRAIAGAGLALCLLVGGYTGSRLTLGTADLVDVALARKVDPEKAQREKLAQEASYHDDEEFYATSLADSLETYKVADPGMERLLAPNTFEQVATPDAPKTVKPGGVFMQGGFRLRVLVESVKVERARGVRTTIQHTLATIENTGEEPVAYFLELRSKSGECKLQATTKYNTMVLSPGAKGELSVCSGSHSVEIVDLRLMKITELGALWVSKVPPLAVGHDEITARSHDPGPGVPMCAEIPAVDFGRRIDAGEMRWEDLIDFYSRHDCEKFRWWAGYTRITEPLKSLPSNAPKPAP